MYRGMYKDVKKKNEKKYEFTEFLVLSYDMKFYLFVHVFSIKIN